MKKIPPSSRSSRSPQQGIALVVALVLMVVATLIGISGVSNITLQERMSGNLFDRSLALQAAETAQRAAAEAIARNGEGPFWASTLEWLDCEPDPDLTPSSPPGKKKGKVSIPVVDEPEKVDVVACQTIPANTFTGAVDAAFDWFDASAVGANFSVNTALVSSVPQFHVQYIGMGSIDSVVGLGRSANPCQYGEGCSAVPVLNYRVISRSQNPAAAGAQQRAIVVIESTLARIQ